MLQIHIDGAKRSGKTTLANGITRELSKMGMRPVLIDMDEVRVKIFGTNTGLPDSEKSLRYGDWVANAMYETITPAVLSAGGTPILVLDHDRNQTYQKTKDLSDRLGTNLKFLVIKSPDIEEASRRSAKEEEHSDMKDFSHPDIRASFERSVERIRKSYDSFSSPDLLRIKQEIPEDMLRAAINFISV